MMKSEIFQKMITTETLQLPKWQRFWHFSVVLYLLIIPIITTFSLTKDYFAGLFVNKRYPNEFLIFGYAWLLPAVAFYFRQKRCLRFKTIFISIDAEKFHQVVKETAKGLGWQVVKKTNTVIVAKSGFSWRSWGELITIIREKDRILFNSICDPDNRPSVASWGMNRRNRKIFEEHLRQTVPDRAFVK